MNSTIELLLQTQTDAVWLQTAGLFIATLAALAIYALQAVRARTRALDSDRRFVEAALALAQQIRKLFHRAAVASTAAGSRPAPGVLTALESEQRELSQALSSLSLEHLPYAGMLVPMLRLRACLSDMTRVTAVAPRNPALAFARLHHRADVALTEIEALRKLAFEEPRLPLRRRSEAGMPTTTVDQYATFSFPEQIYLEPDGIDFEVLVNNQSVRCWVSREELDQLAEAMHIDLAPAVRQYEIVFKRMRESFQGAAEHLIRAGERSPVEVRGGDVQAVAGASMRRHLSVAWEEDAARAS